MTKKLGYAFSVMMLLGLLITPLAAAQAPTFDSTAAEEEGYWYSRYNLGNLVMRSGLGDTFMPEPEMVMQMVKMVDANPNDGDTAVPPLNVTLLRSVFASADPHYITPFNPDDYSTQRWDPASFDRTVTTPALAWTIIKETEWAKQFHVDSHFGTANDSFGAQQRFVGMALNAEAKMQIQYALQTLKNDQGLFANSDGVVDYSGNWAMLIALSDSGSMAMMDHVPHSSANRYLDNDASMMFLNAADMLYGALANRTPAGTDELSLAVQGLTWFAAHATNADHKTAALAKISQLGDTLANGSYGNATEKGSAIRGLVEAYRASGNNKYLLAAANIFNDLAGEYNAANGVFSSQSSYTIDNIAVIFGALNSLKIFGGNAVDQSSVENIFTTFYENAVDKSGLQMAAPPIPIAKGVYEQDEPEIFYSYPGMPAPPMAGGEFGVAPVFATEISFANGNWSVTNARFDSAGAMHASNEFIWFHNDEVDGFPVIKESTMMGAAPATLPVTGGETVPSSSNSYLLLVVAGLLALIGGSVLARRAIGSKE